MRTTTSSLRPRLLASTALLAALLLPLGPASAQETTDPATQETELPAADEEILPLDPLTVTGTKTPRRASEVPATIDVIDQEQLERKQPQTVGDVLNDLPGVEMEGGNKGSSSQPNIRGMGSTGWGTNRVVTLIDGARQNVGSGHGGMMFIDPDMVKQIEVMKGPGSTLYGSGAIGGVIAIETKDAADFIDEGDTVGLRGKVGFHSVNEEPVLAGTVAVKPIDQVDFLGNIVWRDSIDYKGGNDGARIDDTEVDILSGLMKLGIEPADGHRLELSGLIYENDEDETFTDVDNANTEFDGNHAISKSTATLNYSFDSPDTDLINLKATAYRDDTDTKDTGDDYDRVSETRLTTTGLDVNNTFEFDSGWAKHATTFGTEYYHDSGEGRLNGDVREQFPDATQDVVGVYLQHEIKLFDQVSLTPGVRWDYYQTNPESSDFDSQSHDRISPKIGLSWEPFEWVNLYASYAEGYRAPSVSELYIGGTHFAVFGPFNNVFVANPDLKPETAKTWEGGVKLNFGDVVLENDALGFNLAYHTTRAKNFIDGDVIMNVPVLMTTTPVNVPRAKIDGIEVGLNYDADFFFFSGGYSRIRGWNQTDDEYLNSIPADKLVLTVGARVPQIDVTFGVTNEYLWSQNRAADEELRTDGVNLVGLFASWEPSEGPLQGFRVDAGIENLTDEDYTRFLATEEGPGRDYRVAVSYGMSF
ncbi:TonB-dependent hemoglobin/transferrin/lactoferrin family receptor [Dongia sp.]|uniref:TonB-dependent hemoglobin/transferrin/lactoferrin family receptor n=1 Tax=Dongia sp. TaxID=1977262 RepID=UPI0035AD9ABA